MKNSVLSELEWNADDGALWFKGVRYLLIRPETLYGIVTAAEDELGEKRAGELLYRGGFLGGKLSGEKYREALNLDPRGAVEFMCKMGGEIGWGRFELVEYDHETPQLVVHIHRSAFAHGITKKEAELESGTCHLIRGVLGGLVSGLTGKPVVTRELQCSTHGHAYCRIRVEARA
jgi:predicted hydrocarbon binding protein